MPQPSGWGTDGRAPDFPIAQRAPGGAAAHAVDTTRRVLEAVELPGFSAPHARLAVAPGAAIVISDDSGGIGRALACLLHSRGFTASLLDEGDRPETLQSGELAGLILIGNLRPGAALDPAFTLDARGLTRAFGFARAAAAALRRAAGGGGAIFATVSRMDGAFGMRGGGMCGGAFDPSSGGLAGLSKTASHEWPEVRCRALDVDSGWADRAAIAEAIFTELACPDAPVEVGMTQTARFGLELKAADEEQHLTEDMPTPARRDRHGSGATDMPTQSGRHGTQHGTQHSTEDMPAPARRDRHGTRSTSQPRRIPLEAGDVVVVTGGARGVTAECALALARAVKPTLVLVGRSALHHEEPDWLRGMVEPNAIKRALLTNAFPSGAGPTPAQLQRAFEEALAQREVATNLARIAATGATVHYRSADVRDAAQVLALCEDVRRTLGPIRGIVHAAGVIADARIEQKTDAQFARVLETKVGGLENLIRATAADDLGVVALFSSVSGRYGREGQVDYAIANEVLNKAAHWIRARRPSCRVVSIGWGPWAGGMVNARLKREFARLGVGLVPLEEGARLFVEQLGQSQSFALRGSQSQSFALRPLSSGEEAATEVLIGGTFPESGSQPGAPPAETRFGAGPASERDALVPAGFELRLRADDPLLRDHVIAGRPVAPAAMLLEYMVQAAARLEPSARFSGVRDFRIFRPCWFEHRLEAGATQGEPMRHFRALRGPQRWRDGNLECTVAMQSAAEGGDYATHVSGCVRLASCGGVVPEQDRDELLRAFGVMPSVQQVYGGMLFHGPAWQGIETVEALGAEGVRVALRNESQPSGDAALSAPLLIDVALQLGLIYAHVQCDSAALPSAFGALRIQNPAWGSDCRRVQLRVEGRTAHKLRGDVAFLDGDARVMASMRGVEWTMDRGLRQAFGLRGGEVGA